MNRLKHESSTYLRLHADNPVDWYPWGDEAFERARREDKPVFLSIGYSTCHWCHVMARESFEDGEVARLMNDVFVSIKVDREERPDIDRLYMAACQIMTGTGGWPLTILLTPDKHPFFAATYLPKSARFGRMGMMELIAQTDELWRTRRNDINRASHRAVELIRESQEREPGEMPGEALLTAAYRRLERIYDSRFGGFGGAPKFPAPHIVIFLIRHWKRTGEARALAMAEHTLDAMRRGGVYDQVGFGFHRYATDEAWRVPHFEKMLYDQAMLILAFTEAFHATKNETYARTVKEITAYVLRDMTSEEGLFFAAEDAESDGEEGKYYLWTEEELANVLGGGDAALAQIIYGTEANGNFLDEATGRASGSNILYDAGSRLADMTPDELETQRESIRQRLYEARLRRPRPRRDEKILTDWNGLMIAALAKASRIFNEPPYRQAAEKAAQALLARMTDDRGRLFHCLRNRESIPATLDDYAFVIWGLIELYEATFDPEYFQRALALNDAMRDRFEDPRGGFFFTAQDEMTGPVRQKDAYDGAIPSGNSIALWNLVRLGLMTGNQECIEGASRLANAFSQELSRAPAGYVQLLTGFGLALGPSFEIVVTGTRGMPGTEAMLAVCNIDYLPEAVVLFRPQDAGAYVMKRLAPFTKDMDAVNGKATAYVCSRGACSLPVTDVRKMRALLRGKKER